MLNRYFFEKIHDKALRKISGWSEEDLKMKFIAHILELGWMVEDEQGVVSYFDKHISATVEGIELSVKTDFMLAEGVLEFFTTPYFYFQEYKPIKNPSSDSMAQLLQAFLISQEMNQNGKPLYGVEIIGKLWNFVTMEGKTYCISKSYDCTDREELIQIIAILRNFKRILFEELVD